MVALPGQCAGEPSGSAGNVENRAHRFGSRERPMATEENRIIPIEQYGLRLMSMGFLLGDGSLFLVPLEGGKEGAAVLRTLLGRVMP